MSKEINNLNKPLKDKLDLEKKQDKTDNDLATTDKTIVGAINELFQDVDSGKQLIANAIDNSTITKDSTFEAMSTEINNLNTNITLLTNQVNSLTNELAGKVTPAGTAVAGNVLSGKTFINSTGNTITGSMTNRAANTNCVSTSTNSSGTLYVRIPQGAYVTNSSSGYPTIDVIDSDFVASNIVSGKNIFGVTGTATAASMGAPTLVAGTGYVIWRLDSSITKSHDDTGNWLHYYTWTSPYNGTYSIIVNSTIFSYGSGNCKVDLLGTNGAYKSQVGTAYLSNNNVKSIEANVTMQKGEQLAVYLSNSATNKQGKLSGWTITCNIG